MNILIVDDHPLVRRGLVQTLAAEPGMAVAGEAGSVAEARALLRAGRFDVVILDINLPDGTGFDVLHEIRQSDPRLPVLVLSIHPEGSVALRAIKAGANGYLSKDGAPEELALAVRRLAGGGSYVSRPLADLMVQEMSGRAVPLPHEKLSDREYQVMCLLASGKPLGQIAESLGLSPTTVSTYRGRVLDKMGFSSNADLTRYAVAKHLIS